MIKNIFISYSRREVGFVDDLVRSLEERKYEVWLDYRNLAPGTPWLDQIHKGIQDADDILLVVSKASLGSQNVEVEWRRVLEQDKRIILLIFEAVDLPPELEKYEWVDFRGSYKAGLGELFSQLEQPIQEEHPVPQTGFKIPGIVWAAALFSVIVGIISLSAFWTLFIPWLLALLPYRIFKRNYNFTQVQTALWVLPVALFLTLITVSEERMDSVFQVFLYSIPMGFILLFILRSAGMQRWGKEQAVMPKFANPFKPNNPNPQPVPFFVDHAPEDRKIANELTKTLEKYGHPRMENLAGAKSVFVLLSRFESDTEADPEKQIVFPLVIQTGGVSQKLSKIQWVDLRQGVRGLDAIAQLLPEPDKLLKALGNRPRGNQLILPAPISAMYYFLLLLGVFVLGGVFKLFFGLLETDLPDEVIGEALGGVFIPFVITLLLAGGLLYWMERSLILRRGRLASFLNFSLALLLLGFLLLVEFFLGGTVVGAILDYNPNAETLTVNSVLLPLPIYMAGVAIMGVFLLFRRRDIMLWFPAKK